jgi:hypothetical protein
MDGEGGSVRFDTSVEKYREWTGPLASNPGDDYGAFYIPGPCGAELTVIASPGNADPDITWEHVSVSTRKRCPNWKEMCFIKGLFFDPEETVMQLHPPQSKWINVHPFCLHLWRPLHTEIPLPPEITVGPKELSR